ncbi:MAG: MFS transporter [Actinomycetia bacterium]|nr:MFS transporter [Actinomycetes bacterium]
MVATESEPHSPSGGLTVELTTETRPEPDLASPSGPLAGRGGLEKVPARAWRALAVASLGTVVVGWNSTATNIAFRDIADSFPASNATTVSWVASGYLIGTAAFLPLGGRLADRLGRRRIFLSGLALFAVSAILSALAPTVLILIAARGLQALAGGMVLPASLALVLPGFPESRRSSAIGLWSAAGPLSAAFAPGLSAWLLSVTDWRWVYAISTPIALVMFVAGLLILEELEPEPGHHRLDLLGAALGTAGIGLVVLAISQGSDWGYASPWTILAALEGVAALGGFLAMSLHHPEPLLNVRLFRLRGVWVANAANFFISFVSLPIWLVWPLYLGWVWDYSNQAVGLGLTAGPVCAGISTVLFSRLSDRIGARPFIRLGPLFMMISVMWCFLRLDATPNYWAEFAPSLGLFGLGWGMCIPQLNSMAVAEVEQRFWGETNATFNTLRYAGAAVGTAGAIAILGSEDRPDLLEAFDRSFLFFAVSILISAVLVWIPVRARSSPDG